MSRPIIHPIPVCPFCQRLEILLALKGLQEVDITRPRSEYGHSASDVELGLVL